MNPETLHIGFHQDIEPVNRGWTTHVLFVSDDPKLVKDREGWKKSMGYLKVCYIPRASFNAFLPTLWHYKTLIGGWSSPAKFAKEPYTFTDEDKAQMMQYHIHSYRNMEIKDIIPHIKEAEEYIKDRYSYQYKRFKAYHVDRPYVQYANVEPQYRRKGIATRLYFEMADRLHQMGFSLYSASTQSPSAELFWENMRKIYPDRVKRSKSKYHEQCYRIKA
jgi:GNAT superfamily N-acetyltransferase